MKICVFKCLFLCMVVTSVTGAIIASDEMHQEFYGRPETWVSSPIEGIKRAEYQEGSRVNIHRKTALGSGTVRTGTIAVQEKTIDPKTKTPIIRYAVDVDALDNPPRLAEGVWANSHDTGEWVIVSEIAPPPSIAAEEQAPPARLTIQPAVRELMEKSFFGPNRESPLPEITEDMTRSFFGGPAVRQETTEEVPTPAVGPQPASPRRGGMTRAQEKSPAAYSGDIGFIGEHEPAGALEEQLIPHPAAYEIEEYVVILDKMSQTLLVGQINVITASPTSRIIEYGVNVGPSNLRKANSKNTGDWIIERPLLGAEFPITREMEQLSCDIGSEGAFVIVKNNTTNTGIAGKILETNILGHDERGKPVVIQRIGLGELQRPLIISSDDPTWSTICSINIGDILPPLVGHESKALRRRIRFAEEPEVREELLMTHSQIEARQSPKASRMTPEEAAFIGEQPIPAQNRALAEQGKFVVPQPRRGRYQAPFVGSERSKYLKDAKAFGKTVAQEAAAKARAKREAAGFRD